MSKLGKGIKRVLKWFGIFLVVFIGALIAIPYFFKDDILNAAKDFANKQINATLAFDNDKVGLSLLWTFPNFSFSIGDLTVTGHDEFKGKKLVDIGEFYFTINLMDAWAGNYIINGISLSDADFYVKVLRNGKANYDIMKPSDSPTDTTTQQSSSNMKLDINYWAIENTNILYDDEPSEIYMDLKNLNHTGSGDFSMTVFDLYTQTTMDELSFSMGNIRYLKKAKIAIDFNANIDLDKKVYKIMNNSFQVNALTFNIDGQVATPNDSDKVMDLKFNVGNTAFASVLSLIPSAYTKDFKDVQTKGTFKLGGYAKGTYNDKGSMPAFGIDLAVKDGQFKYPSLPMSVEDINTNISVKSASSDFDKMTVDVTKFHVKVGKNPFDATLKLRTPISDPDIDTQIDGTIDLDELSKAFPMEGVKELNGIIKANLVAKTKMSYVNNSEYDKVNMDGHLGISNMNYTADGLPPVKIINMAMHFTPNNVDLQDFDLKIGKSDIKANGKLDNILTYFAGDKIMKGNLVVSSTLLDLDEMSAASASGAKTEEKPADPTLATEMQDTTTSTDAPVFDRFEFAMDANFKEIKYDVYEIKDVAAKGSFSPSAAVLDNFQMMIGKVDLQAKGRLDNVFGYVFDNEIIKGTLVTHSNYMNLNQFMSESGAPVEKEPEIKEVPDDVSKVENDLKPMQLPGNIDFTLMSTFSSLIYDTYNLKNVQAAVHIHDHILDINALRAEAFGGGLALNGQYDTRVPEKPKFKFGYDVSKLDIQTIAKQVGLSQRLMPIVESIYGQFSSEFEINGVLDENLYPDMASLSAKGILKTFNTVVKNNESLNKLSDQLKMPDLKTVDLANTTNFFTLEDGRLKIDPASYNVKGMDIIFGGSHGLDNSMAYDMKMRVPRALLAKNPVGAAVNTGLSAGLAVLAPQAEKLGIKLEDSEFININVGIGGTVKQPKFTVNLMGAEAKGGQTLGNQAANLIKEEAEKLKNELEAKAKEEADRLRTEAEAKLKAEQERLKKEAEEKAKQLAQQAANNPSSVVDSLKNIKPGEIIKDPTKVVDPSKLGDIFNTNNNNNNTGGKKEEDKKNPFGNFKNPFGPK